MKNIYIISAFLLIKIWAQDSCKLLLYRLSDDYKWGRIEHIEQQMLQCLKAFSKKESAEAYRLLCLRFIHDQNIDKAKLYLLEWLKLDPKASIEQEENTSLNLLYQQVDNQVFGAFCIGLHYQYGWMHVARFYSLNGKQKDISYNNAFNFKLKANYLLKLNPKFYLNAGVAYAFKSIRYQEQFKAYSNINGVLNGHFIQLSCMMQRSIIKTNYIHHLGLGFVLPFKLQVYASLERKDVLNEGQNRVLEIRNFALGKEQNWINVGASIAYTFETKFLNKHGIGFTIYCHHYFLNWNRPQRRYFNTALLFDFFRVPDDYFLSELGVGIFIKINQYKPKFL